MRTLIPKNYICHQSSNQIWSQVIVSKAAKRFNVVNRAVTCREQGSTPLHMAASTGHQSVFDALLHARADVNATALSRKGELVTPMDSAARGGGINFLNTLKRATSNVTILSRFWQ